MSFSLKRENSIPQISVFYSINFTTYSSTNYEIACSSMGISDMVIIKVIISSKVFNIEGPLMIFSMSSSEGKAPRYWDSSILSTVKILKFGTPQTIAIIVLKIEKFDVTLH